MVMSGNAVTITLGTQSAAATAAAAPGSMSWTPSASATDPAGNAVSTTAVTESGAADKDF
jgi:chitinase